MIHKWLTPAGKTVTKPLKDVDEGPWPDTNLQLSWFQAAERAGGEGTLTAQSTNSYTRHVLLVIPPTPPAVCRDGGKGTSRHVLS